MTPDLAGGVLAGNRRALAKAITLLESRADRDSREARELLERLLPHSGKSLRIGISGAPGVGKSTLIERLGSLLVKHGHRVAVLSIDPSSSQAGGSILADKTRMQELSTHPAAFVRPSPSSGVLGGVGPHTRESMFVCEAAGFDVVIVETVGVGQSEIDVANMTDVFVLMQLPNQGDELQAMKKGVLELADFVVINKADLDHTAALRAQQQVAAAFMSHLVAKPWKPEVLIASAGAGKGIDDVWERIQACAAAAQANGGWSQRRHEQTRSWLWQIADDRLRTLFRQDAGICNAFESLMSAVDRGDVTAPAAAHQLLDQFLRR